MLNHGLCVLLLFSFVSLQIVYSLRPPVACPEHFQYQRSDNELRGKLTLPASQYNTKVVVELSQREPIESDQSYIKFSSSRQTTIQNLRMGRNVSYAVGFPIPSVRPKLILISVNDTVICSDSKYPPPSYTIRLETTHTLIIPESNGYYGAPVADTITVQKNKMITPELLVEATPRNSGTCGQEGNRTFTPFINGGTLLTRGQFPWLTALYERERGTLKFICGGSLISSRAVISAAHCFRYTRILPAEQALMYLGRHDLENYNEEGAKPVDIQTVLIHPDFNTKTYPDADIAILQMRLPVQFTEYIQPICLWAESDDAMVIVNQTAFVAGWGGGDGHVVSPIAKVVDSRIASDNECMHSLEAFKELTSSRTLCVGNLDGTGPCMGDSGGGLMIKHNGQWMLRGVVSVGETIQKRCNLYQFVVYCDLAKHMSWVRDNALL